MSRTLTLTCSFALGTIFPAVADAPYAITRSVIATGGGTSSGGAFSVTGTVGETGAGGVVSFAKTFDLASGFWAGRPAVMWPEITPVPYAPDAPTIRRFSWSPSRSSWVIDYSENLQQWIRAQGPPTTTGFRGELGFTVPAGFPRFYIRMVRLQSP